MSGRLFLGSHDGLTPIADAISPLHHQARNPATRAVTVPAILIVVFSLGKRRCWKNTRLNCRRGDRKVAPAPEGRQSQRVTTRIAVGRACRAIIVEALNRIVARNLCSLCHLPVYCLPLLCCLCVMSLLPVLLLPVLGEVSNETPARAPMRDAEQVEADCENQLVPSGRARGMPLGFFLK